MQKVIFREKIASILYLISGFLTIVTVTSLAKLSFSAFMCLETVGVETYGHKGESVGLVTITFRLTTLPCIFKLNKGKRWPSPVLQIDENNFPVPVRTKI